MKYIELTLDSREIELLREAVQSLGVIDSEATMLQLKVAEAILDAETYGDSDE